MKHFFFTVKNNWPCKQRTRIFFKGSCFWMRPTFTSMAGWIAIISCIGLIPIRNGLWKSRCILHEWLSGRESQPNSEFSVHSFLKGMWTKTLIWMRSKKTFYPLCKLFPTMIMPFCIKRTSSLGIANEKFSQWQFPTEMDWTVLTKYCLATKVARFNPNGLFLLGVYQKQSVQGTSRWS